MQVSEKFGQQLWQVRSERKLTKDQMAELCGVSGRHYSNLEHGKSTPLLNTALRISVKTGISLDALREEEVLT